MFWGYGNLKKPFRFGGWKKNGHKKRVIIKTKKRSWSSKYTNTIYIYIHTTYGTLGNTYPPGWSTRGGEWREMARCRQVAMAAQVWCCSIASIQGDAADETTGNHRNDSLRSLPMKKKTPKHQKRKLYILYIYIVLWQHVYIYIYILICIYIYSIVFQFFHFSWRFYKLQGCSVLFFNSCWMHDCRLSLFEGTKWFLYHFSTNV